MTSDPIPATTDPRRKPWRWSIILLTLCLALGGLEAYVWLGFMARPLPVGGDLEAPSVLSFDDSSNNLKDTIFVPTLERPIPDGKSAVWCATAPMAWQELETAVKKPVDVRGAEAICRELRETPDAKLAPEHFYVAAGRTEGGVADRIGRELSQKFPNAPPLPAIPPGKGTLAFAYLEVAIFFDYFFKHSADPIFFKDSGGRTSPVHAFGIRKEDVDHSTERMREQVLILFRNNGEFALDLSHNTQPYQIILARMAHKPSLKQTLAELDKKAAAEPKHLNHAAIMLVPSMHWKVTHRYSELEGPCVNDPREVEMVYQSTHFKMDRKGAYVASATTVVLPDNGHPQEPPNPDHYFFDRPFLVVMKRRGVNQPFFVMWVDNAELLQRR